MNSHIFFITLLVLVSLSHKINGDNSREIQAEFTKRYNDYKFYLITMCYGFQPGHIISPNFSENIDYSYWYDLCDKCRTSRSYFRSFITKEKARIMKEVKADFKSKNETKTEN